MSKYKKYFCESIYREQTEASLKVSQLESELIVKYPQIQDLDLYVAADGSLYISSIRIKEEFRGKGIGSQIMEEILKFADATNMIVTLAPEPQRGFKEKLMRFYKQFGFIPNKGRRAKSYLGGAFGLYMYRMPKQK